MIAWKWIGWNRWAMVPVAIMSVFMFAAGTLLAQQAPRPTFSHRVTDYSATSSSRYFVTFMGDVRQAGTFKIEEPTVAFANLIDVAGMATETEHMIHIVRGGHSGLKLFGRGDEIKSLLRSGDIVIVKALANQLPAPGGVRTPEQHLFDGNIHAFRETARSGNSRSVHVGLLNLRAYPILIKLSPNKATATTIVKDVLGQSDEVLKATRVISIDQRGAGLSDSALLGDGSLLVLPASRLNSVTLPKLPSLEEATSGKQAMLTALQISPGNQIQLVTDSRSESVASIEKEVVKPKLSVPEESDFVPLEASTTQVREEAEPIRIAVEDTNPPPFAESLPFLEQTTELEEPIDAVPEVERYSQSDEDESLNVIALPKIDSQDELPSMSSIIGEVPSDQPSGRLSKSFESSQPGTEVIDSLTMPPWADLSGEPNPLEMPSQKETTSDSQAVKMALADLDAMEQPAERSLQDDAPESSSFSEFAPVPTPTEDPTPAKAAASDVRTVGIIAALAIVVAVITVILSAVWDRMKEQTDWTEKLRAILAKLTGEKTVAANKNASSQEAPREVQAPLSTLQLLIEDRMEWVEEPVSFGTAVEFFGAPRKSNRYRLDKSHSTQELLAGPHFGAQQSETSQASSNEATTPTLMKRDGQQFRIDPAESQPARHKPRTAAKKAEGRPHFQQQAPRQPEIDEAVSYLQQEKQS